MQIKPSRTLSHVFDKIHSRLLPLFDISEDSSCADGTTRKAFARGLFSLQPIAAKSTARFEGISSTDVLIEDRVSFRDFLGKRKGKESGSWYLLF